MLDRRDFAKFAALVGGAAAFPWRLGPFGAKRALAQLPGGTLPPGDVPKYQMPLAKPPKFPFLTKFKNRMGRNAEYYELAVREFMQPILPPSMNLPTKVWSYGPADDPRTVFEGGRYFYPAFTIEAKYNTPTVVKWINMLDGKQHLLPVDPSLHWANTIGRRDTRPNPTDDPTYWNSEYIGQDGRYIGPVPMVVHLHGGHTDQQFDGYPEAWWLPASAGNGLHKTGTFYDFYKAENGYSASYGWEPGAATFRYRNDQPATTLWYHDHTLGMTRLNVYAGPAGFYLLRGGDGDMVLDKKGRPAVLPGPAPGSGIDPFGDFYEIPIVIQDRSFNADGSLFYPDTRAFFEETAPSDLQIPFTFDQLGINSNPNGWGLGCDGKVSDVAPIWNPEFFGNMMVVNGFTWPYLDTEQRRYRFRLLNGCNSRFLILQFNDPRVEVWQIGADQGFLPAPVRLNDFPYPGSGNNPGATILMAPAERADVIVDFTNVPRGTTVTLLNLGPDEPFGGGDIDDAFDRAHPSTTGQVMEFRIVRAKSRDRTTPPWELQLPAPPSLGAGDPRDVSLNEESSQNVRYVEENGSLVYDCSGEPFGPTAALLGNSKNGNPLLWADTITENPDLGSTEEWTIYNFTADAHPIHVHLVQFQVVNRQALETDLDGVATTPGTLMGSPRSPEAWEAGFKDTVIAYPGEATRVKMKFDLPGFYVWHCHIVEHEDNEMMRPYKVG